MTDALADTNIVMRWALPTDPQYPLCRRAVRRLKTQGVRVYITPQILIELWAVVTRPREANGLGRTAYEATQLLRRVRRAFPLLEETPDVYREWLHLVRHQNIVGRQVYDARLVAVMQVYQIETILTLNGAHFRRFESITVLAPEDIT